MDAFPEWVIWFPHHYVPDLGGEEITRVGMASPARDGIAPEFQHSLTATCPPGGMHKTPNALLRGLGTGSPGTETEYREVRVEQ